MRSRTALLLWLVLIVFGLLLYKQYKQQQTTQQLLENLKSEQRCYRSPEAVGSQLAAPGEITCWSDLQVLTKDTVVQIFTQGAQFNWLEPYKAPNQFQVSGSGFFVNADGSIITNAHVVSEAKSVSIQIPSLGKRRYDVDVIGVSPERDLALLKLRQPDHDRILKELGKMPVLNLGDSDKVHRADEIMALGYPLGQQSLKSTTGVVSGREHIGGDYMIQISAPINPGSSGGPSLSLHGDVIGVNRAGIMEAQNVGYIIPSNEVKLFLRQLEQVPVINSIKFLRRPFLGVLFNNATEYLTSFLGNPPPGGLYVVETYKGSPLHKAGILPGDMIYEIDGHVIDVFGEMNVPWSEDKISIVDYVSRLMLGDKVNLVIYRSGTRKEISFAFSQVELAPIRGIYAGYEKIDYEILGGMVVMPLALNHLPLLLQNAPELVHYMEFKNQMEPALIVPHVLPDSFALRSRTLVRGAIIQEINGEKVKTLDEFRKAVKKSTDSGFLTVKTSENVFTVFPFQELLAEEQKLAQNYFYQLSPFVRELLETNKHEK